MDRFLSGMVMLAVCSAGAFAKEAASPTKTVELKNAQGASVGLAQIKSARKGVLVELQLKNLPPGAHAVHFHTNAKCESPDFKSAGPHFDPAGKKHGLESPHGHHNGDMPNVLVKSNGTAKARLHDLDVTLASASDANSLFANGGTTIVVHAKADDMKTDPSGNSGDRIACGAITE
jgi:Cu-Zn family superoxide dismutase